MDGLAVGWTRSRIYRADVGGTNGLKTEKYNFSASGWELSTLTVTTDLRLNILTLIKKKKCIGDEQCNFTLDFDKRALIATRLDTYIIKNSHKDFQKLSRKLSLQKHFNEAKKVKTV